MEVQCFIKKEDKGFDELKKCQTYKFNDTQIYVEPVFLEKGNRTIFHSLGRIILDDVKR